MRTLISALATIALLATFNVSMAGVRGDSATLNNSTVVTDTAQSVRCSTNYGGICHTYF